MMTELSAPFFYLFAGLAIAFSIAVVFLRNPVSSAFALVIVFFCFAAIYAMLGAHLIAALQILVYAGAIMVLFIFVIMLLNADAPSFDFGRSHFGMRVISGLVAAVVAVFFVQAFRTTVLPEKTGGFSLAQIEAAGGNTKVVSVLMFSEYVLPFELTSLLILAGIVGSVAIAKRKNSAVEKGKV
jgi:NADH-quinone oxidoreductase subunit J